MTSQQFLAHLKQQEPAAAYLFAGPEPYQRDFCRKALIERVLPDPEERESGFTRHDLQEMPLEAVIEDARSLSLFTSRRVIVATNAEAVLPRGKAAAAEDSEDGGGAGSSKGAAAALEAYLRDPVPGVVLVFEAARYDFQGEDKKKLERVQKFFSAIRSEVDFPHLTDQQARTFARKLAGTAGLKIGDAELDQLVEALGGEAARIAAEIEKLRVYSAGGKEIGSAEISQLVPEARESTIFALVGALGRNDRAGALDVLDTLIKQSEYLPLALSFLATQFRLALAAKEAGLRTPQQIQAHFAKQGIAMWGSRAEQVFQTVSSFSQARLAEALKTIFSADKSLRDARPDDRVVMEQFVLRLTG
jgi:DNA polymerase III subunit delta